VTSGSDTLHHNSRLEVSDSDARPVAAGGGRLRDVEIFASALELAVCAAREAEVGVASDSLNALSARADRAIKGGALLLTVDPFGFSWAGRALEPVDPHERSRFELYACGVRGLRLQPGVTRAALGALVSSLATPLPEGEDRLTVSLGRLGAHIHFEVDLDAPTVARQAGLVRLVPRRRPAPVGEPPMAAAVLAGGWSQGGPDAAPARGAGVFLSALRRPGRGARYVALVAGLRGRPESVAAAFDERVRRGDVQGVVELMEAASRAPGAAGERLQAALLQPDRLRSLGPLYAAEYKALTPALRVLCRRGAPGLIELLSVVDGPEARNELIGVILISGCDLVGYYQRQLSGSDEDRLLVIVAELDSLARSDATRALVRGLTSPFERVRRATLEALVGRWDVQLRGPVGRALKDPDRDIRLLALRILQSSGDQRVGGAILAAIREDAFAERDSEERRAFYTAVARFENQQVVGWFEQLLKAPGVMRRAIIQEQLLAIESLAEVGGWQARRILDAVAGQWYHPRPVRAALREASEKL